jgi:tetratricopeptide (TPR) repeat protein
MSGPSDRQRQRLTELARVLKRGAEDSQTLTEYGCLQFEPFQNADAAMTALQRALELDPQSVDARFWLAKVLYHSFSRLESARTILEETLRLDPQRADCVSLLASVLQDLGIGVAERLPLARRATELAPDWVRTHQLLAAVAREARDYGLAKQELEKAIELGERQTPASADPAREYYETTVTGRLLSAESLRSLRLELEAVRRELSRQALYGSVTPSGRS